MSNRLGGLQGTAYLGTNANQPPNMTFSELDPTQYDSQNVSVGDFRVNTANETVWCLVSLEGNIATWVQLGSSSSNLETLTGNDDIAVPTDSQNNINVVGDGTTITIAGDASTHTLTASLISGGTSLTLTGDNSLAVSPDGSGTINILGGGGTISVVGDPSDNTLTVSLGAGFASNYIEDSGSAQPSGGVLNIAGGSNINTSGTGNTVTVNLNSTLTGLTNLTVDNLTVNTSETLSFATAGVVQSDSSGHLSSTEGTDGQILIGSTSGAPAWANITAGSNVTITNAHNSITIAATGGGGGGTAGLIFLGSIDVSITGSAIFSSLITSTYRTYLIVADKLVVPTLGTAGPITINLSFDNGSTFPNGGGTGAYRSGAIYNAANSTTLSNATADNAYFFAAYVPTDAAAQYVSFNHYIYDVPNTNNPKLSSGQYSLYNSTNLYQGMCSGVYHPSAPAPLPSPVNAIGIFGPISFTSGTIELYGLTD